MRPHIKSVNQGMPVPVSIALYRNLEALNIKNLIMSLSLYGIWPLKPGLTVLRYSALLNFALGFAMWHVKTKKN